MNNNYNNAIKEQNSNDYNNAVKEPNGTTVVGIKSKEGVVIASDTRTSSFFTTMKKDSYKIMKVNENVLIGTAGFVGHHQQLKSAIKNESDLYEAERGRNMSTKSVAHFSQNQFINNHYHASALVVGFDEEPKLYYNGGAGSVIEYDNYIPIGSGGSYALGVLEQHYKKDISLEEAKLLAKKVIETSHKRDNMSGDGLLLGYVTEYEIDIQFYESIPEEL